MKRIIKAFIIILLISTGVHAEKGSQFALNEFKKSLKSRLTDNKFIKEFSEWEITKNQSMHNLFAVFVIKNRALRKCYDYFKITMSRAYGLGIDGGFVSKKHCKQLIDCNTDILIGMFRRAIISSAVSFKEKTQLDINPLLDNTATVKKEIEYQKPIINENDFIKKPTTNKNDQVKKPHFIAKHTFVILNKQKNANPPENIKPLEDHKIKLQIFENRLYNAIKNTKLREHNIPKSFKTIALKLVNKKKNEKLSLKNLKSLDKELHSFIKSKMKPKKEISQYSWWERKTFNCGIKWLKNRTLKKLLLQRINKRDIPILSVALNVRLTILQDLYTISKKNSSIKDTKRLLKQIKETAYMGAHIK